MVHVPKVSIGLPIYNAEQHLDACVRSLLDQTLTDFELILSDNASRDGTADLAARWADADDRIRFYQHPENKGAAFNFNFVADKSRAPLFKWVAHDDLYAPTYLEKCVEALDRDPKAAMAFARRRFLTPDGRLLPRIVGDAIGWHDPLPSYDGMTYGRLLRLWQKGGRAFPPLFFGVIRRPMLEHTARLGAFHPADIVFVPELRLQGHFIEIPEDLLFFRLHGDTPDRLERSTPKGMAAWYDPTRKVRFVIPTRYRLAIEHLRGIKRAPIPWWQKAGPLACYAGWAATAAFQPRGRGKATWIEDPSVPTEPLPWGI